MIPSSSAAPAAGAELSLSFSWRKPLVAAAMLLAVAAARAQSYSVASCSAGSETTITGVVYDPAGKNPLPNILVYVPQGAVSAFSDGVNTSTPVKDSYNTLVTGNPLVSVTTGADGSFSLSGVPAGTGVPLVIQAGRWRRQFVISSVGACTTTALYSTAVTTVGTDPTDLSTSNVTQGGSSSLSGYGEYTTLRFARNQNEGDIPRIAFVTGASDALECTVRKVGIDDSEFTDPNVGINSTSSNSAVSSSSPAGRISLFQRNTGGGAEAPNYAGAKTAVATVQTGYELFGSTTVLDGYNVLMLPCAGKADPKLETGGADIADAQNVASFTNAGGRIFSTHFSSDLLNSVSSISGAANWISPETPSDESGTAIIYQASTDSDTMRQWLYGLNGGTEFSVPVSQLRISQTGTNSPTVNWATLSSSLTDGTITVAAPVVEFSYYTPVTAASTADQYGRVFFTDYHVNNSSSSSDVFPAECTTTMSKTSAMSTQEQMLEYSLFQLMNFAIPQFVPSISVSATASPATLTAGDSGDGLTLTIANNSGTQPITLDAPVTMAITLPAGVTATGVSATGWTCTTSTSSVACTLASQLAPGASNTVGITVDVGSSVSNGSSTITAALNSEEFTSNPSYSLSVNSTSAVSTITALGASPTSVDYAGSVNLTATVTAASGTASGTVTFYDGGTALGTSTLNSGTASLSTSALTPGSHSITAIYNATSPYTTSTSTAVTVTVASASTTTTLTASPTTVTAGTSVNLTAVVASAYSTPTGTVTFYDGTNVLGTGTLSNGQATYTASSLTVGPHNITAVYGANTSWATSTSAPAGITVTSASTTTALSASASNPTYGSAVTFTASVSSQAGTPTGTVTFYDGGTTLGTSTMNSGTASLTTSTLIPGGHSVTAVYNATSPYTTSTSTAATVTVASASTTTVLSAPPPTVVAGHSLSLTAIVVSAYSTPTGTVTFYDGTNVLGTVTLSNGHATYTTTSLAVGTHDITAVYGAGTSWATSTSAAADITVTSASTTTALSASTSNPAYGSAVTFTASVSSQAGTPTGTVTFYDGGTALGTSTLNSGTASLTTSSLIPGGHSVTAVYNATSPYTTSTSAAATVTVASASTTTTLTTAPMTVTAATSVNLTAVVASGYSTPTGTVTFYDGTNVLGTATLSNGQATYPTSSLAVGTHNITAVYGATTSWATSTSASAAVTVTTASTTTALSPTASNPTYGSPVTFTVSVSSQAGTPSGTVTFYDGAAVLGTVILSNGAAALTTSALAVGTHNITVVYGAAGSYAASTSSAVQVSVTTDATVTTLSASGPSAMVGSPLTFTAQVASAAGTPSGSVSFFDGAMALGTAALSGGTATLTTSNLAAGTHNITAVYGGAATYAASTSPALPESVIDLGMTVSGTQGGDTTSTSTTTTVTAQTGGSASVLVLLTSQNTALPVNSTLTVTGQPAGTIVTVTGENWQATSASTWVYPKGYAFTTPTVTFQLPSQLAAKSKPAPVFPVGTKPIFLGLMLLPFMRRRGRRTAKRLLLLAVVALSMAGTLGLTGCAAHNGFYAEKSYPVTITLTAGTVSKVSYVTLNVN